SNEALSNSDGLNYMHKREVIGLQANVVERHGKMWRVYPNEPMHTLQGLRAGLTISRNRDHAWEQALSKKSAERRIAVSAVFAETADGFALTLQDADGISATANVVCDKQPAQHPTEAEDTVREQLARFGNSDFELLQNTGDLPFDTPSATQGERPSSTPFVLSASRSGAYRSMNGVAAITVQWTQPWFIPSSLVNKLRREAVEKLETARLTVYVRPSRKAAVLPPANYPEESLSFLANVYNASARAFYAKHGVKLIAAAYEAHQEPGEVSLMVTRHCIRYSLSLCPKQAKGVIGVQGQVRAEPMKLINGNEQLTLVFDCKACEMHVMGKMKKHILKTPPPKILPLIFHPRNT
ncbi:MAG: DUF3656 domain-containing protein, partial [Pseudomonadota bacterium]